MDTMQYKSDRGGFTLIELIVVIAICGVLMGLLLVAVQSTRATARRLECLNHLKQIGLALHQYHDSQRSFPPGCSFRHGLDPQPFMTWMTRLLPYLEQETLWRVSIRAYAEDKWFESPPHFPVLGHVISAYTCPADSRTLQAAEFPSRDATIATALTAYLGVEGTNQYRQDGVLYLDSRVRMADIIDGMSNTLMVGERPPSANLAFGWWYAGWGQARDGSADSVLGVRERNVGSIWGIGCPSGPYEFGPGDVTNQCDAFHYWSLHLGGANFLFADGSARFLSYSAAPLMPALATRAGRESVSLP